MVLVASRSRRWCWWLAGVVSCGRHQLGCLLRSGQCRHSTCCGLGSLRSSCSRSAKVVMVRCSVEQDSDPGSGVSKNGNHSRRMAAIRFYLLSRRQFSAHTKSSRARIDKRTARAARNTHYRYNKNGPLDHKMADNCVSLACTNTVSSTITKTK